MFEKEIEIHDGLRNAFEGFKHYKNLNKKILSIIKEFLPDYFVNLKTDFGIMGRKRFTISVYGQSITYNNSFGLYFNEDDNGSWQEPYLKALDRMNMRDSQERHEQEQSIIPELERLNQEIQERTALAHKLVSSLPIPASATLRKESHLWESPSKILSDQFPVLFKG